MITKLPQVLRGERKVAQIGKLLQSRGDVPDNLPRYILG